MYDNNWIDEDWVDLDEKILGKIFKEDKRFRQSWRSCFRKKKIRRSKDIFKKNTVAV